MFKELANGIHLYNNINIVDYLNIIKSNIEPFFEDGSVVVFDRENNLYKDTLDLNHRKVKGYQLSNAFGCHNDDPILELKRALDLYIGNAVEFYRKYYNLEKIKQNHDWNVIKYDTGSFFNNHIDDCLKYSRTISVVGYFNDDFQGGEIEFPGFNVFYKPSPGDILIFPSSFIYLHNIKKITAGVRYAVVNWYSYINDENEV